MSLGDLFAEGQETYPYHHKEDTDGTKSSPGWGDN